MKIYNYPLIQTFSYEYKDLDFKEIAISKKRYFLIANDY